MPQQRTTYSSLCHSPAAEGARCTRGSSLRNSVRASETSSGTRRTFVSPQMGQEPFSRCSALPCDAGTGGNLGQRQDVGGELLPQQNKEAGGVAQAIENPGSGRRGPGERTHVLSSPHPQRGHSDCVCLGDSFRAEPRGGRERQVRTRPLFPCKMPRCAESWPMDSKRL